MSRPRVMHVVVAGAIGGAERMVVDLASRAVETGADHTIALMTPNRALARMLVSAGIRVLDRGPVRENAAAYLWRSLGPRDAAWLARQMHEDRTTVAHLHTFGSQVIGTRAARSAGARAVRTEHSTRVYDDPSCWPFSRWSLQRVEATVAISAHVRTVALSKAPWARGRMRVIANGVDTERFAPREDPAPGGALRLVRVGRLEPRKGIDLAIDALAGAPDATLEIVGDGEERVTLEALVRARHIEDRVRFHGYLADPREILASADAALCSSRSEGLGIGLLEAMAMGKPVLAVPVGGVPELVRDDETGWLARDRSPQALAARMYEAFVERDRAPALGRAARARVERSYSISQMCTGYREVYATLAR